MSELAVQSLLSAFESSKVRLPGDAAERSTAIGRFAGAGFPTRRQEDWKYTDLARALRAEIEPATPHEGAVDFSRLGLHGTGSLFASLDVRQLVFVNGFFRPDLSDLEGLEAGLEITPASGAQIVPTVTDNAMVLLNAGLWSDGAVIDLAAGVSAAKPIHLIFVNLPQPAATSQVRTVVRLAANSSLFLFESRLGVGSSPYLANDVVEIELGDGATLDRVRLQDEGSGCVSVSTTLARLGTRSRLAASTLGIGAELSRDQAFVTFAGEGAQADLSTAAMMSGSQHLDTTTVIDHSVPGCSSSTLFKGVFDQHSSGAFQGKVHVAPHAQHSDGRQMTNALLLSRDAAMNAKPELEIYADDVQCAHGSTIGELDEQALFYLRSRGIDAVSARQLLVSAFVDEVFDNVGHEPAREALKTFVGAWMYQRKEAA